jgi:deoxycytidylate deaminase
VATKALKPVPSGLIAQDTTVGRSPRDQFHDRRSQELVVAFSGPIGCGTKSVIDATQQCLSTAGYDVVVVKISDFIEEAIRNGLIDNVPKVGSTPAGRYERLQSGGNALRTKYREGGLLAEYVVQRIAEERTKAIPDEEPLEGHVPRRRAFLVDQLKHPEEVQLLRTVYRNLFYLIGVLSVSERRSKRLMDGGLTSQQALEVMERDRKEPDRFGQQLDKTLELADFFIRNDKPNVTQLREPLGRFVGLMHGDNGLTPTKHEYGMYVAYAAALGSACLSRQVGAAIMDLNGNVLSSGRNDVPQYGGGLYSHESESVDARCVKLEGGKCWNDLHKKKLHQEIADILKNCLEPEGISETKIAALSDEIAKKSRIKDLIEFSRSIHAEMDALLAVARQGGGGLKRASLYVTTFPCHSCARHIVAAGISKVYYIEPYEKSLAQELHSDSISLEPDKAAGSKVPIDTSSKVEFIHFEGVAPRQFLNMFRAQGERKLDGVAVMSSVANAQKVLPEYLDSYREFETKVVKHFQEVIESRDQSNLPLDS